ncbi:MAG: helix-turn-helix transcriptional regulator [Eubacteriales bacterium]|nr:helix-turn-helix transcriptional regulator [Eubacteriales bacterium]
MIFENDTIAERLRTYRVNCGLTQSQVANAIGMERTGYGGYETGRAQPSLETIVKLAQIFRVDPKDILPSELSLSFRDSKNDAPSSKPIYTLTKDEQSLLISYRLLTDREKSRVLAKITNMSQSKR